jgi:hypothetical protein
MKVYLSRTATLIAKGESKYELGWKSTRGTSDARHIEEATPVFAEMAAPGTAFEGAWSEASDRDRTKLFQAANTYAASQLTRHKQYAQWTGLAPMAATIDNLENRLRQVSTNPAACLLAIGWGGGLVSKVSVENTADSAYRAIAKRVAFYQRALQTGMPFPKTRRVIFQGGKAAQVPGWVLLEVI